MKLLEIRNLSVEYKSDNMVVQAVNDLSLSIDKGSTLGLVGETGAGKTTTALSILRLLPVPPSIIKSGKIYFNGQNILEMSDSAMRKLRGNQISMIFQDPMTALNPVFPVGEQIAEVVELHNHCSKAEAQKRSADMLEYVGISAERGGDYPHQLSGGMKQRVLIAIALACEPELLIADEPTTALDVTIQAQVLDLMRELKNKFGTSMLLITHDLGVVAETCDTVAVMYAGEVMEYGTVEHIFNETGHAYTQGLFGSIPSLDKDEKRLHPIMGLVPDPMDLPNGCRFNPRCPYCTERCIKEHPDLTEVSSGHFVRCHWALKDARSNDNG